MSRPIAHGPPRCHPAAKRGTPEHAEHLAGMMQSLVHDAAWALERLEGYVRLAKEVRVWEHVQLTEPGKPLGSWAEYCRTRNPYGLAVNGGGDMARDYQAALAAALADDTDLLDLLRKAAR